MKDNALENLANAGISLIKEHAALFSLESALAKQSIAPFFLSVASTVLFAIGSWISLCVLITYGIYVLSQNLLLSLIGILTLHILLFGLSLWMTMRYQQRMKFQETRAHLKEYFGEHHE